LDRECDRGARDPATGAIASDPVGDLGFREAEDGVVANEAEVADRFAIDLDGEGTEAGGVELRHDELEEGGNVGEVVGHPRRPIRQGRGSHGSRFDEGCLVIQPPPPQDEGLVQDRRGK
jgi:hypothetical protein